MTIVPVGDYRPDVPAYLGTHATVSANVYPRLDGSDGPLQAPVSLTAALTERCRGAVSAQGSDGTSYVVAGIADKLFLQSGTTWTDKSALPYATPTGYHWKFALFGKILLATNWGDEVQAWTLGAGGNFAGASGDAPQGRYIATIEPGFVMLGWYYDGYGSVDHPAGLQWSAINDSTSWPQPGTSAAQAVQSDVQDLPSGGRITGLVGAVGGAPGAVFTERSAYRIEYVGSPAVFAFREVERTGGCMCPQSLVTVQGNAFYVSEDGFQRFDGTNTTPIGFGRVDKTFLNELDPGQLERVYGMVDPFRRLIVWAYPNSSASSGNPNKWLIYNYGADRWSSGDDAQLTCELLFSARSAGYTLDTLDTVLTGGIDAWGGYSMDSPLYSGGQRLLAGFSTGHALVSYEGATLAACVETGETDSGGNRVFVSGIRPLTDAANVTASVGYRETFASSLVYTTARGIGVDNHCPVRQATRYARARIDIPAGEAWTYLQGADVRMRREGRR